MSNEQLTAYLKDESYLYTLGYEELKTLVVQYPYAANLRILLLKKAHLEQNKDYDRNLQMAAAYSTNRRFLYKLVKKLKALQAVPENVILSEDYLELTELSNIEKILPARQPAEGYAANENTKALSADFRLNFETPSRTPEDDEALFNLNTASTEKLDFDFMTEEEVDLLVEDIVSKFKVPEEAANQVEKQEALQELLSQQETSLEDFQSMYIINGVENPEITEGGTYEVEKPVETPLQNKYNTLVFDPTEDPEWASNVQEDTLIDDEISKLEVFNHSVQHDEKPIIESIQSSPSLEFDAVEIPEIVSTVENIEIIQAVEMPESLSHAEHIDDFKPTETFFTETVVNENVSSEIQDLYYTSSLPLLEEEVKEIPEPSITFIENTAFTSIEPTKEPEPSLFIEDITQIPTPEPSIEPEQTTFVEDLKEEKPKVNGKPIYQTVEDFKIANNLVSLPTQSNGHMDIAKNINEITPNITIVSRKTTTVRNIEDLIEADKNIIPVSKEKEHVTHLEDLLNAEPENLQNAPSVETSFNRTIEDLVENKASENLDISTEVPIYKNIEDITNTSLDDTVFMEQLATDNSDSITKKKDTARPLIEFEITNQSKVTLVEKTLPPSVSDNMTSFAEWLQQFQKPNPADFQEVENEKKAAIENTQEIVIESVTEIVHNPVHEPVIEAALDNFASSNKSLKQRKYKLDNLTDLFEDSNGLPDNLFFGLNSPSETQAAIGPSYDESASILDKILDENYNGTDDKDIEWLKIPIENITKENGIETEPTLEVEESSEINQEAAPQKKKKKKMMHELAARSLETDSEIISEPLADIYAAQGLKSEAIEMYQRLSLQIPEKSDFFAAKIEKLRNSN
jgi:hypothetical protein